MIDRDLKLVEKVNHAEIWGKSILVERVASAKALAWAGTGCWRNNKKV